MKINKVFKLILIALISLFCIQFIPNKVEAASKPNLKVSYNYDSKKDVVTVKVKSNKKLKKTKPTWTLSKDKKTYSKKFYANESYKTTFTATNGGKKTVQINVKKIKGPKVTVKYNYDKKKNTVKVTLKSNKQLKNTLNNKWTLSKDKKVYTRTFNVNTKFDVTLKDTYGNKTKKTIDVTQIDKKGPKVDIKYKYDDQKNNVFVTITADEEMKRSINEKWILSSDKKTYTRIFDVNTKFDITLKDIYGNKTKSTINVTQIDDVGPKLKITYKYDNINNTEFVTITSNEELSNSLDNTWTLSEDKKVYTKNFNKDTKITLTLKDKYGNITKSTIKVGNVVEKGIDVSSHNGKINWVDVKSSGIDFAIIRCGFGKDRTKQDDTTFDFNIKSCEELNIPYGIYIYSYALDTDDAKSEVEHVKRLIEGHNPKYGIWFDMEDADGYKKKNGMPTNEMLVDICDTFCSEMKNSGYKNVGIYASLNWWNNILNDTKLDNYDKWLAQWPTKGRKTSRNRSII